MDERIIGIKHRVKKTAEGDAHPTQLAIHIGEEWTRLDLPSENEELDFLLGRLPISYRKVTRDEDLSRFLPRHIKWKKLKTDEDRDSAPENLVKVDEKKVWHIATSVPKEYDGLREGDTVVSTLGGSGSKFMFALSRRSEEIGARVMRVPDKDVANKREDSRYKDEDCELLVQLWVYEPDLFYPCELKDRALIRVGQAFRMRMEAQDARKACQQRVIKRTEGMIFCSLEGRYPEGNIEDEYAAAKANDDILQFLIKEEKKRDRELAKVLDDCEVFHAVFEKVKGCGPAITSPILAQVADIRRFADAAKLKKFCGVAVMGNGTFTRKRKGENTGYTPGVRQALFNLGDQFNRSPDSEWGMKLLAYKEKLRLKHPHKLICNSGLSKLYREIERYFDRYGVDVRPKDHTIDTVQQLMEMMALGLTRLPELEDPDAQERQNKMGQEIYFKLEKAKAKKSTVQLYGNGHIHKMALWHTLTKFVEWMFDAWWAFENSKKAEDSASEDLQEAV